MEEEVKFLSANQNHVNNVLEETKGEFHTDGDSRPSWEDYFLRIARDVATRSNCCRRKVGAVIVKDNHIIATGYNGTPAGTTNCFDGGCPRCSGNHKTGEKLDECLCVHAEQNAICQAAKYGNAIDGGHIYITCSPCLTCLKLIINAGINRVVFEEWNREFNEKELNLIKEAGLVVVPPDKDGRLVSTRSLLNMLHSGRRRPV